MNSAAPNLGGRPPKFETPEEFKAVADAYFAQCKKDEQIPTVNGLCLALGIWRQSLLNYEDRPGFLDTVKAVRAELENAWEQRLGETACTGAIFWLKNQGWRDKTETEHTGPGGSGLFAGAEIILVRPTPEG